MGNQGSIPGLGRSPREGNGYQLQYPCLENPVDRGAWWATVHGSRRVRHDWETHTFTHFSLKEGLAARSPGSIPSAGESRYLPYMVDCLSPETQTTQWPCIHGRTVSSKAPPLASSESQEVVLLHPHSARAPDFSFALSILFHRISAALNWRWKPFLWPKAWLVIDHFMVFWWFVLIALNGLDIHTSGITCDTFNFSVSLCFGFIKFYWLPPLESLYH